MLILLWENSTEVLNITESFTGFARDTPCAINKRERKLQLSDLYNIITKNNIKTDLRLFRHAMIELNESNNPFLSDFIMTKDDKRRNSMIATAWKLNMAAAVIERTNHVYKFWKRA